MNTINAPRKDGRTPLRVVAMSIKQRCHNPNHKSFRYYGAKGITLWENWRNDYESFEKYCLENGWMDGLQVDRIDSQKGYEPGNIQFIPCKDNIRKKKSTKLNADRVKEMFALYNSHKTHDDISIIMDIEASTVSSVLSGKKWADVHSEKKSSSVNGKAQKLTSNDVKTILKAHYLDGVPKKRLARQYGLAPNNMRNIITGKFWNELYREFQYLIMFLKPSPTAAYAPLPA